MTSADRGSPRAVVGLVAVVARSFLIVAAVRVASVVPPAVGYAIANGVGRLRTVTLSGRREVQRMRRAFPDRDDHAEIVRSRGAIPARNLVAGARLVRPGVPDDFRRHRRSCPDETAALLDSDRSFVLAAPHLAVELFLPLADRDALDRDPLVVVGTGIEPDQHPWEQRAHRRAVDAYNRAISERGGRLVELGDAGAVRSAIRALRDPGRALIVFADAEVGPAAGAVVRPFAGRRRVAFATGAARLARLAAVPVVVCSAHRDGDQVVLDWSTPIEPSAGRDGDASVTRQVLDLMETIVARQPGSYALPIGGSRRWDGSAWVPLP